MIVRLTAAGAVVLDADDCTALHLETDLRDGKLRAALATTNTGEVHGQDVLLDVAVLRSRAKLVATADDDWAERWSAMIEYARTKGWVSADGRSVQVHVEPLPPR